MAKEIIKKKQRIAHNKANNEDYMPSECQDLLASIMGGMDSNNLEAVHLNKYEPNFEEIWNFNTQEKTQNNTSPSANQSHGNLQKSKKLGLSRKFPLMEKSQRALKQLKHNRQMPKPRAHLAGLSNSSFDNSASIEKSQKTKPLVKDAKIINKFQHKTAGELMHSRVAVNGSKNKKSFTEEPSKITSNNFQPCTMKKGNSGKELTHFKKSTSKAQESSIAKGSVEESSHLVDKNCIRTRDNSSDSDEYEKFIKNEKKTLPKKSKSEKNKSLKNVSRKRGSKAVVKSVPLESESEESDEWNEETVSSKSCYKKSKRMKKTHKVQGAKECISKKDCRSENRKGKREFTSKTNLRSALPKSDDGTSVRSHYKQSKSHKLLNKKQSPSSKEDSESEMDMNDETHHNSSSESEDLPSISEITDHSPFNSSSHKTLVNASLIVSDQPIDMLSAKSLHENSFNTPIEHSSSCNKRPLHQSSDFPSLLSNDQSTTGLTSGVHLLAGSALSNKSDEISSLVVGSGLAKTECVSKNNIEMNSSCKQENSNKSLIFDLTVSDKMVKVEPSSLCNKISSHQACNFPSLLSNDQSYTEFKSGSHSLVGSAQSNVPDKISSSLLGNDQQKKSVISKSNIVTNSSCKQENSLIVDLTESDNECESPFAVMPKIVEAISQKQNDSDESDIQLIDVRAPYLPQKPTCLNNSAKINICKSSDSKICIKTENVDKTLSNTIAIPQNTLKSNPDFQTSLIVKHEVAYSTGICQDTGRDGKEEIKQSNLNNKLQSCSEKVTKVKLEPLDDCVIVHETTSTSNSTLNLQQQQIHSNNIKMKVEKESKASKLDTVVHIPYETFTDTKEKFIEKRQKLHEVAYSNLKKLTDESLENEGMSAQDIKALLDNLKEEFSTYISMLETEQFLEDSFKRIEMAQAKKLMSLKSKITKLAESLPSNTASSNSLKNAMKMFDHSELSNRLSVKDCDQQSSISDISMQVLVPLSSIPENDIKPNLSELQQSIKKEPDEINSMSFGEKCIVCAKDASAACQQCAKVFFCSNACGMKYWEAGHKNTCVK